MIAIMLALAAAPAVIDPGPQPSWDQALRLGNAAIVGRLIDPESARVAWPYGFFGGSLKGLFSKRQTGWITCGLINAKNRMGGYTGTAPFLIVIHDSQVVELDIGEAGEIDVASATCPDLIKKGLIRSSGAPAELGPLVSTTITPQAIEQASATLAAGAAQQGGLGISFITTPAGLVLLAVAPGSPAAGAGLKPGQVLQSVNGVDLRSMPQVGAVAVLKGLPRQFTFTVAGAGDIKVTRP